MPLPTMHRVGGVDGKSEGVEEEEEEEESSKVKVKKRVVAIVETRVLRFFFIALLVLLSELRAPGRLPLLLLCFIYLHW